MKNSSAQKSDINRKGATSVPPALKKYLPRNQFVSKIKPATALIFLMIAGLALRLFLLRYRFAVAFDEVNYLKLGVSGHLNGLADVLHTYWSPLLPTLISFFCILFSDFEFAARLVSILAGALLVFPVYFLGKQIYDRPAGLIAAAFVALFPPLAFQSTQILTEPVFMLLAALAILFGMRMLKQYSTLFALLAGISSGLAYLSHPQGVGFFLLLLLWIAAGALTRLFLINRVRILWLAASLILGFLFVSAPYLWYLKKTTGAWTFSAKAVANWQMEARERPDGDPFRELNDENTVVPIDQVFHEGTFLRAQNGFKAPVREVRVGPFIKKYAKNLTNVLKTSIPEVMSTFPFLLFGIGLFGAAWKPQQGKLVLYLVSFIAFFWLGLVPAFHINLRYLSPLLPVCAVFVARGVRQMHEWLSVYLPLFKFARRLRLVPASFAAAVIFTFFVGLSFLPETGRIISNRADSPDFWADPVEQKAAGLWLKKRDPRPKIIMSRNHAVDFYAGSYDITKTVTIPKASLERVLAYAKHKGVNYLVLNERYEKSYPELGFLVKTSDEVPGLRQIYNEKDQSGLVTRIYQVNY